MTSIFDSLPFSYNTLMFWGSVAYTIGFFIKQEKLKTYGGYSVIGGVLWYFIADVLGLSSLI